VCSFLVFFSILKPVFFWFFFLALFLFKFFFFECHI